MHSVNFQLLGICKRKLAFVFSVDYPDSQFNVSAECTKNRDIDIEIVSVVPIEGRGPNSFCYRAWITVKRNDNILFKRYYADIDAVGGNYGIHIPKNQPKKSYKVILKKGDYDGRLWIVQDSGIVTELIGGDYFITADQNYIFSVYYSDIGGLAVFDLNSGKTLFSSKDLPSLYQWYEVNGTYFFTVSDWTKSKNGYPNEDTKFGYFFDFKLSRIVKGPLKSQDLSHARKIRYLTTD